MINKTKIFSGDSANRAADAVCIGELYKGGLTTAVLSGSNAEILKVDTYSGAFETEDLTDHLEGYKINKLILSTPEFDLIPRELFDLEPQEARGGAGSGIMGLANGLQFECIGNICVGYSKFETTDNIDLSGSTESVTHIATGVLSRHQPANETEGLVIFYPGYVWVFAWKQMQVVYINAITYKTASDIVYYLLGICRETGINPGEMNWFYSGLVDEDSTIMNIVENYIHKLFPLKKHEHYAGMEISQNMVAHLVKLFQ